MKKKVLFVSICAVLLVLAFITGPAAGKRIYRLRCFADLPEYPLTDGAQPQETCPLCAQPAAEWPLLVDLNTGTVIELRLYDPAPGEGGVMFMGGWPGGSWASFPGNGFAHISIRRDCLYRYSPEAAALYFCRYCLAAIAELELSSSYILVDGGDIADRRCYDLKGIEGTALRQYTFEFDRADASFYSLYLFSEGRPV